MYVYNRLNTALPYPTLTSPRVKTTVYGISIVFPQCTSPLAWRRLLTRRRIGVDLADGVETLPRHLQHGLHDGLGYSEGPLGRAVAVAVRGLAAVAVGAGAVHFAAVRAHGVTTAVGSGGAAGGGRVLAHVLEHAAHERGEGADVAVAQQRQRVRLHGRRPVGRVRVERVEERVLDPGGRGELVVSLAYFYFILRMV